MNEELVLLFSKYLHGTCNHEEINRVAKLMQEGGYQTEWELAIEKLANDIAGKEDQTVISSEKSAYLHDRILQDIQVERKPVQKFSSYKRRWLSYAAVAAFATLVIGAWFYREISMQGLPVDIEITGNDILPASNRATLKLAEGRAINLSASKTGIVTTDNQINYQDQSGRILSLNDQRVHHLELTTPRGGTYTVILPDGSKVWLNAASSLKYPSRFTGNQRLVEIEGEAYFVIANDAKRPFKVQSLGQEVEVLGTAFNISAYPDDKETKTTLVSGAVQITVSSRENRNKGYHHLQKNITVNKLLPGEQGTLSQGKLQVNVVDVMPYVGWKEGDFVFNGLELREAMKQLSRWYDVDVVYEGDIPPTPFYGSFSRAFTLSKTLEILKEGHVNFSLQQHGKTKRLIVKQ